MSPEDIKKAMDVVAAEDGKAAIDILKNMLASLASGGAEPAPAPETEAAAEVAEPPPADEDEATASVAASKQIFEVLGAKTAGEATAALSALVARVKSLDDDRAALDLSERQGLVTQLVTAGVETPATAWADATKRQPKKRLMDEPIAELRERVKIVAAKAKTGGHKPPAESADGEQVFKTSRGEIKLSAREIKNCESQGADVKAYAENKAIRAAARNRT